MIKIKLGLKRMKARVNKVTIQLQQIDIFDVSAAAIVHETNTDLSLNPRLLARAGMELQRAVNEIGYCEVGSAVITTAGSLTNAQKIIHVVGPRWGEGSERGKLASAVFACLRLAEMNRLKSIAFPAISVGAAGYPLENCAATMLGEIIDYTFEDPRSLRAVYLCLNDAIALDVFRHEFETQLRGLTAAGEGHVQV
jgi:O-acetyl-ADP-ribose deacetylase (regulator of RNase III)